MELWAESPLISVYRSSPALIGTARWRQIYTAMFAMAMLLLTSDWLILVVNGDGSSLRSRRFTDSVGHSDRAHENHPKMMQNALVTQVLPVQFLSRQDSIAAELKLDHQGSSSGSEMKGKLALTKDGSGKVPLEIKDYIKDRPSQLPSAFKPLFRVQLERGFTRKEEASKLKEDLEGKFPLRKNTDGFQEAKTDKLTLDAQLIRRSSSSLTQRNESHTTTLLDTEVNRSISASKFSSDVTSNISFLLNDLFGTVRVGSAFKQRSVICNVHEKRCLNGMCVSHVDICPDSPCSISNPFQCQNKWQCVSVLAPCNGRLDCDDGSDEQGCNRLSYPYSHNERIIVVASIIIVVIGTSLFCCLLIHVYRKAHQSNPTRAQNNAITSERVQPPWTVLQHLQNLLSQLGLRAEANVRNQRSNQPPPYASYSFHSIAGRTVHMTRPSHHLQSETIESFVSSAATGTEAVVEQEVTVEHRWTVEATEPPPSYDDAVNLHDMRGRADLRPSRTYYDPSPPPTYDSIFCISTTHTIEV